ncbi:MAG: DNA polymerase IV, partial [Rubricella sp.]
LPVSIGLSHNKFLAKVASDLDKPRGFATIGRAETQAFLEKQPVGLIWGVGAAFRARLEADGLHRIADIRRHEENDLMRRYGSMGRHIWRLAHGIDNRRISPDRTPKSISNETTFSEDIADAELLRAHLWRLVVSVSDRAKAQGFGGRTVTLKLKRADFRLLTRQSSTPHPVHMAETLWARAAPLLDRELAGGPFRLVGVGLSELARQTDESPDLLDPSQARHFAAETAVDKLRSRFGPDAIGKGRGLKPPAKDSP